MVRAYSTTAQFLGNAGRQSVEGGSSFWISLWKVVSNPGSYLVGPSLDEVDDLSIAVGSLFIIAPRLVDHSQSIVAVMHFGESYEKVTRGAFRLIEVAGVDHIDHRIGCGGEFLEFVIDLIPEQI
jgi:hypothetical protein